MTRYYEADNSGLLLPVDTRQRRAEGVDALDAVATAMAGADWLNNLKDGGRKAGDAVYGLIAKKGSEGWANATPRWGRIAGLGTLAAVIGAAQELNDPNESAGRNIAQAVGSGGGGIAGGTAGALIGQALIPLPGVGALVGGAIGSALGGTAGRGLMDAIAGVVEGSPEDRALRLAKKQAEAQLAMEVQRAQTLMPIQNMAAEMALQNDRKRAEVASELQARQIQQQTLASALLAQQQAGANQALSLQQAILGV